LDRRWTEKIASPSQGYEQAKVPIRGLEQHPETKSRWAQMARSAKRVMWFLSERRYVANVKKMLEWLKQPGRSPYDETRKQKLRPLAK
jgi:hypothetical protein